MFYGPKPIEVWAPLSEEVVRGAGDQIHVQAQDYELFDLLERNATALLSEAPLEFTPEAEANAIAVSVPRPDGTFESFSVVESPILAKELADKFPEIKTYRGQGIDNPASTIRLGMTTKGFHAMVLAPDNGDYYIDPYFHLETDVYASYFVHDARMQPANASFREIGVDASHLPGGYFHGDHFHFYGEDIPEDHFQDSQLQDLSTDPSATANQSGSHQHIGEPDEPCCCDQCLAMRSPVVTGDGEVGDKAEDNNGDGPQSFAPPFGTQLRTYELAVATTGEYTQFHGGTVAAGLSAVVVTMNRVNGIYENDLAVRMELVPNNDSLIYTNANTDPYTNNSGFAMLAENQSNVDAVIGSANYDVGHVFSTGGGGIASLGVIGVNGLKARGVTGLPSPIGDPFDVDYVAHELGHQYGGNHTFNGDSGNCSGGNRNGSTAYEPGSGASIQAYAGICGNDNLQNNSDPMFHSESIDEIRALVTSGTANAVATITATGNSIPTVDAGADFVIPAGTPFELTAVGTDADAGDVLTYSWEQRDLGPQQDVNGGDNGSSPLFRSYDPSQSSTRVFPRLADLVNNTTSVGETLPTTDRTMNFRVVARDNSAGGGGVVSDDMTVDVNPTGSAFQVTSQNAGGSWIGNTQETISWDVAGTTGNGINAANVDIFLSTDGGLNYDTLLLAGTPNDGSQAIDVPNIETTQARIKVKASGNIFFDINNANISIDLNGPGVVLSESGGDTFVEEDGATDSYQLALASVPAGAVTLSATADSQTEVSLDGVNFANSVSFNVTNTSATEIFVRAIDDMAEEGPHTSTIVHEITSTNDSADYPTTLNVPDLTVSVSDDDLVNPVFVGVDFDVNAGSPPANWLEINGQSNATFQDLETESGDATPFDLTINDSTGNWNDFEVTPAASTIPQHGIDLSNIDGQLFTSGNAINATWSDLNPSLDYGVYVFSAEGFFDTIEQRVTISGDTTVAFDQRFNQDELFINDTLGSSSMTLLDFALVMGADGNGEISIQVDPIPGTDDVVLAGLAIFEIPAVEINVSLSSNTVNENTDTSGSAFDIGTLSATGVDPANATYRLVGGPGDDDNESFQIDGDILKIKQGTEIDFESQATYSVLVEVSEGANTGQQQFDVNVADLVELSSLVIGDGSSQRSMLDNIVLSFDGIVAVDSDSFELLKRGPDGGVVQLIPAVDNTSGNSVVTLTFGGSYVEGSGSLVDGNYQLTLIGDQIQTAAGDSFDADGDGVAGGNFILGDEEADAFFRLLGDGNGDRSVNIFDLLEFRGAWLSTDGDENFAAKFDFNADGTINIFDLLPFRDNWLETLDFE